MNSNDHLDRTHAETPQPQSDARVVIMPGSTRSGSINQALAQRIHAAVSSLHDDVAVLDLRHYQMPLYDQDLESQHGIPDTVRALAERVAAADVMVIVTPEYNGSFTPLLKNTIDWLTRVDMSILGHLTVAVASASPGGGGGANGIQMVRDWLTNMGVTVTERTLPVGFAALDPYGDIVGIDENELTEFITTALAAICARS